KRYADRIAADPALIAVIAGVFVILDLNFNFADLVPRAVVTVATGVSNSISAVSSWFSGLFHPVPPVKSRSAPQNEPPPPRFEPGRTSMASPRRGARAWHPACFHAARRPDVTGRIATKESVVKAPVLVAIAFVLSSLAPLRAGPLPSSPGFKFIVR